jgi:bifunctional DNA-binding transcriptional regulator/antitoxin component of YhaV-PrlF toxin-antitoxin module
VRPPKLLLDGRGRLLLPAALREAAGLAPGVPLLIALTEVGLRVSPAAPPAGPRPPTIDAKSRLTLPAPLRAALGLGEGATLLAQAGPEGLALAVPMRLLARLRAARLALQQRLDEA